MTTETRSLIDLAEAGIDEQAHSLTAISVAVRALLHGLESDPHPPGLEKTLELVAAESDAAMERARLLLQAIDRRPCAHETSSLGSIAADRRSATSDT